jgi:hypothetical protein
MVALKHRKSYDTLMIPELHKPSNFVEKIELLWDLGLT